MDLASIEWTRFGDGAPLGGRIRYSGKEIERGDGEDLEEVSF